MVVTRVEVTPKQSQGMRDVRGDSVRRQLFSDHAVSATEVRSIVGFLIKSDITEEEVAARSDDLFTDPIIEVGFTNTLAMTNSEIFPSAPDCVITIGFKPGVTDNPGKAAVDGFHTIFPQASDA
jgi:phosphoribosylformylglycinamidine (FGAM) synthase PurS component